MRLSRTISSEKLIILVSSFFFPLLSIPFVFFQIINRKQKIYFSILTIIFGLIAYTTAPTGDLYRHYIFYENLSYYSLKDGISIIFSELDFVIPILILVSAKLALGIQWLSFTVVVVMFSIIFKYFHQISNKNDKIHNSKVLYSLFLIAIIFSQNFMVYSLKLRAPLAQAFILLFFSKLLIENRTKWGIFIFAIITHFSSIIILPILLLTRKVSLNSLRIIFLFSILLIPFSKKIIELIYFFLKPILKLYPVLFKQVSPYVEGYWAFNYFADFSTNALIQYYISIVPYFLLLIYFVFFNFLNQSRKIIYSYFIFLNIVFSFANVFNRFYIVAIVIGLFIMMMEYGKSKKVLDQKIFILSLSFFLFTYGFINILAQRRPLKIAYTKNMLYTNSLSILFNTYSKDWILNKIDEDGYIIGDNNKAKK
jgi:hypothetical protein